MTGEEAKWILSVGSRRKHLSYWVSIGWSQVGILSHLEGNR